MSDNETDESDLPNGQTPLVAQVGAVAAGVRGGAVAGGAVSMTTGDADAVLRATLANFVDRCFSQASEGRPMADARAHALADPRLFPGVP